MNTTDTLRVSYWRFFKSSEIDRVLRALVVNLKKKIVSYFTSKMGLLGING